MPLEHNTTLPFNIYSFALASIFLRGCTYLPILIHPVCRLDGGRERLAKRPFERRKRSENHTVFLYMLWYLGRQQSGRVVCQDRIYTLGIRHEKVSRSGPGPRPYLSPGIAMIPCFPRMMKDVRHVFSASTSFSGRPPPYVLGTGAYTRYSCADGARKSSHMLIAHRTICSLPIEPYARCPSSHMLVAHRAICSLPIEPYARCLSSHMLIAHRAICSLPIEPYAHCPLSHMLIAH